MKRKPKIAVIGLKGLPAFGGAAAVGENIIEQLKDKYDFTVYSVSSHTDLKTRDYNGYRQIVFDKIKNKKLNTLLYYFKAVFHVVLFNKFDLIHIHHSDSAFLLPILRLRYKIIVTTHGAHNSGMIEKWKKFKWFFQGQIRFLKFANLISCVSLKEKEWLQEKHGLNAMYIPNGIDIFPVKNIIKRFDIFFGAGRIIKDKGCHILLKSLKAINFDGNILVAGDLSQSPKYSKKLQILSSKLNVDFIGLVKDKVELLSLLSASKLFVYPTLKEAMSMMLLEAASTGVPIICSDIRENKDVFNNNEVLYFSSGNVSDLAEKIQYAINNYSEMLIRASLAIKKIRKNHNWNKIALQYHKLYNSLLNNEINERKS